MTPPHQSPPPDTDRQDTPQTDTTQDSPKHQPTVEDTSIRVHVSLLDSLMTLAGELVLSRNQLLQTINSKSFKDADTVGQRIDLITSELQEAIMLTRMQPIGNVFAKFPRIVRDLAANLEKKVDISIEGKEVELDKTIIEAINDPLTHLLRNSVDHGIEQPEERRRKGKNESGHLTLRAFHEAGQVVIEIEDDGKGIDGDTIGAKAVQNGLVSSEQIASLTAKEKAKLIFLPGLSTATQVTDVSGRGVGMDVVKSNLDKLGGQIDIISELDAGTTISIKLPLTLAIIPCQIVTAEGERYAIPQLNLSELLRIPAHQVKEKIEIVGDAEVVRLRGRLLPIVRLTDVLGIQPTYTDPQTGAVHADRRQRIADRRSKQFPASPTTPDGESTEDGNNKETKALQRSGEDRRSAAQSALNIVVVTAGTMAYGLVVDTLLDSEEIVIKPLGRHLQECKEYAGATIMGDGRVALILDIANLAVAANLSNIDASDRATELHELEREKIEADHSSQSLLIFRSAATEQFGVVLDTVERIEEVKKEDIEFVGHRRVMQYKDGSLPLVCIDDLAAVQPILDSDNYIVLVFNTYATAFGLLISGPVDTRLLTGEVDQRTLQQPGIIGSAIIDGTTTMLINVDQFHDQCIGE